MWEHRPLKELWSTVGKKNEENLWIMVRTWTYSNLVRDHSGQDGLKEGAVVTLGE
jgi:hypothetical protein